ncbi:fluoride efflux transporter CrcB [Pseudonocardia broussonetiae]|uniref:Fluoride-specific ion channel FluC n=1 Tax=Pseudonocardia broussonetiae TaxID=2736640 RepID=A0A6M6JEK1_9PSEU|nr:fluoride efflux transporter CrcB [Pseudonocardia broussonetiae]
MALTTPATARAYVPRVPAALTGQAPALGAVAVGGALGALARWGAGLAVTAGPGAFPLATFAVNTAGCLLIGALLVVLTEVVTAHPLARPFLATGVLGGFTTFSTYAVDVHALLGAGRPGVAAAYLVGTLLAALAATWLGARLARAAAGVPR